MLKKKRRKKKKNHVNKSKKTKEEKNKSRKTTKTVNKGLALDIHVNCLKTFLCQTIPYFIYEEY